MRETIKKAARRIVNDELGVNIKNLNLVGYMEFPSDGNFTHSVSIVFQTKINSGKPSPKTQANEIKYFKETPTDMHPEHKKFMKEFISNKILPI